MRKVMGVVRKMEETEGLRETDGSTEAGAENRIRTKNRKDGVRHGIDKDKKDRVRGSRERNIVDPLEPDLGKLRQRFPNQDKD